MGVFIDLIGRRFGRLLVLSRAENKVRTNSRGFEIYWNCICDCGRTKNISSKSLRNGVTKSCNCISKEEVAARTEGDRQGPSWRCLFRAYEASAKTKKIEFKIDINLFKDICSQKCFFCGVEPSKKFNVYLTANGKPRKHCQIKNNNMVAIELRTIFVNGIDRFDNDVGYLPSNLVACCSDCNYLKTNRHGMDFLAKIKQIYLHTNTGGSLC